MSNRSADLWVLRVVVALALASGIRVFIFGPRTTPRLEATVVLPGPVQAGIGGLDANRHRAVIIIDAGQSGAQRTSAGLAILDTTRGTLVWRRTTPAGEQDQVLALDAVRGRVVVHAQLLDSSYRMVSNRLDLYDVSTGALVGHTALERGNAGIPYPVAAGAAGRIYVLSMGPFTSAQWDWHTFLSVLDGRTGHILRTGALRLPFVAQPLAAQAAASGRLLIVQAWVYPLPKPSRSDSHSAHTLHLQVNPPTSALPPSALLVLDLRHSTLLGQLQLGHIGLDRPGIAVDEERHHLMVALPGSVRVLDLRSGRVVQTIAIAGSVSTVAVDQHTGHAFVPSTVSGMSVVVMFDSQTGRIVRYIPLGHGLQNPIQEAIDTRSHRLFVLDGDGAPPAGAVSVLDTATGDLLDTVPAGGRPRDLFVDQQSGLAFVLNAGYGVGTSSFFATAPIPSPRSMGSAAHTPWWQAITQALPWNTLRATPTPDIEHATVSVLDASR